MIEFPTFPRTVWHPTQGGVVLTDPGQVAKVCVVATDWFDTAAEADAHRTQNEADVVMHKGRRDQVQKHEDAGETVVHHSVTHQETVNALVDSAAADAEATGAEPPKKGRTTGAELLT